MVGTSSAAISAASHKHMEDDDAHLLPTKRGVVDGTGSIKHSCLTTAYNVTEPIQGQEYA